MSSKFFIAVGPSVVVRDGPLIDEGLDGLHERRVVGGEGGGVGALRGELLTDALTLGDELGGFEELADDKGKGILKSAAEALDGVKVGRLLLERGGELITLTLDGGHGPLEGDVLLIGTFEGEIAEHLHALGEEVAKLFEIELGIAVGVEALEDLGELGGVVGGGAGGDAKGAGEGLILGEAVEELCEGDGAAVVGVALLEDALDLGLFLL